MFVIPRILKQFLAETCVEKNTLTLDHHLICPNYVTSIDKFSSKELCNILISSKSHLPLSKSYYNNKLDQVTLD